jgi:uncharacterized protein DUF4157
MILGLLGAAGEEQRDGRVGIKKCTFGQVSACRAGNCPFGQCELPEETRVRVFLRRAARWIVDARPRSSEVVMYGHDHTYESESSLRPKASRLDESESALAMNAALAGRLDAAGPAGVVGLQRAAGNAGTASLLEEERSPVHDVVGSGGAPLEPGLRADMEGRFGQDFGDVRIHNDGAAHHSAKSVNAQAYTVGSDIVFQRDNYDPASDAGKHMLAHELTHVVQQRNGPVDGTDAGGGVKVSDPSDRFEREAVANADQVMSGPAPAAMPGVQRMSADGAAVQREEAPEEEEETAQTYVQREEEEAEEEQG